MSSPLERISERWRNLPPEYLDKLEAEAIASDPAQQEQVAWRDDGPDPFGMDWAWSEEPATGRRAVDEDVRAEVPDAPPLTIPFRPVARRRTLLWASGIAASIAFVAFGTWAVLPRKQSIREQSLAAWVAHKLVPGGPGLTLTAAPEDEDADRSPMRTGGDRPLDAKPPAQPNIHAPIRIQEQLVVPPKSNPATKGGAEPVPTVTEKVSSGSLFYLEFSTAGARGEGSAVAIRVGTAEVLAQEVPFGTTDVTSYLGPLKMGDGEVSYLVVIADRRSASLLDTVAASVPRGRKSLGDVADWRPELAAALMKAGHEWYGLRRINVQPEAAPVPTR